MSNKYSILIIEDEKNINNFIAKFLPSHGYKILTAFTGKEGLEQITSCCPDLVLLDLGLPDMDGIEIIKQMRIWSATPIIVLSARTSEKEKVLALDAGADDYITKPFGFSELLARIRTSLRHSNRPASSMMPADQPFCSHGLKIDFDKRQTTIDGKEIHLTPIEYKIVSHLAKNAGKVITYTSIMEHVWGPYTDADNKILRVNMANIRRKMEKNPAEPNYIFTELGVGYRMIDD